MLNTLQRIPASAALVGLATSLMATFPSVAQERTSMVPQEEIENTYRAKNQGEQLYRSEKYEEAIPYLKFAAERGFKEPQAQLGSIYVNGLGGVKQDLAQGVGWLGVAASGKSKPEIKKLYKQVRKKIPKEHDEAIDGIVDRFTRTYDGHLTRVVCEMTQRAGTNTKVLRCRFLDEGNYPSLRIAE